MMINGTENAAVPGRPGRGGLNGNQLRLIAVISMVIDHTGVLLWKYGVGDWLNTLHTSLDIYALWFVVYGVMRAIGRIAFPVFVVLLVSGYLHTHDWKKYALRLALLAVISEVPFDFVATGKAALNWNYQNTVFTLLLCLLMLRVVDRIPFWLMQRDSADSPADSVWIHPYLIRTLQLAVIAVACLISLALHLDYSYEGILLTALIWFLMPDWVNICWIGGAFMAVDSGSLSLAFGEIIAFLLLYQYNGEPGERRVPKWQEYGFYPLHLVILWICYMLLSGYLGKC